MGQSSSKAFQNSTQPLFPKRKTKPSPGPPVTLSEEPSPPSSPSYVVAENKVLPNGVHDMNKARKLLRPVSQELTKFHPEYADMFPYSDNTSLKEGDTSLVNGRISLDEAETRYLQTSDVVNNSSQITGVSNGESKHVRKISVSSDIYSTPYRQEITQENFESDQNNPNKKRYSAPTTPDVHSRPKSGTTTPEIRLRPNSAIITPDVYLNEISPTNLTRSQSVSTGLPQHVKPPKHKRQTSIASGSSSIQENVILEDPREHLYNAARESHFTNFQPSGSSLPVRNTFDMDYSLNLTYAQLAEFRRNKRTSGRLSELEAEINASSTLPKSPFDRQYLSGQNGSRSISMYSTSTGSSDTGVSRSKKRRAPEPPKIPPAILSPGSSVKDSSSGVPQLRGKSLQRSVSSTSGSTKPPAPQPVPKSASLLNLQGPTSNATHEPPHLNTLPGSSATLPRQSSSKGESDNKSNDRTKYVPDVSLKRSIFDAKAQLEALDKLREMLKRMESEDMKSTENKSDNVLSDHTTAVENVVKDDSVPDDNGNNFDKDNTLEGLQPTSAQHAGGYNSLSQELHTEIPHAQVDQPNLHAETQAKVLYTERHVTEKSETSATAIIHECPSEKISTDITATTEKSDTTMNSHLQREIIPAAETRRSETKTEKPPSNVDHSEAALGDAFEKALSEIVIAKEDHRETVSHRRSTEESTANLKSSKSQDENSVISHSNSQRIINRPMKRDYENEHLMMDDNKTSRWGSKHEDKVSMLGNDADREDMSSAASMDISKRSSIQSEDMSISSSNTSQRIFSSDWAPEHDLDPDDDMMDEQDTKNDRRVSSEGFKPTMIPSKVRDLKESKMNKSIKKNKQNERTETKGSSTHEKTAIGSIRKFKKSVHQSMKNVFGSISKASGALLNKQKSQEFLDNREGRYMTSSDNYDDEVSAVLSDLNWTLSSSRSGSLRRAVSDGFVNKSEVITTPVDLSESSDDDDDEVGDIDFANGINDIPSSSKKSYLKVDGGQKQKVLKHAGVAYVGGKGQIIVLPQYRTVHIDEKGRVVGDSRDNEGHAPKINKTKGKKYTYESTLRKEEKYRVEEALARLISEKEEQYEVERLRQKEIENSFKRLRELEIKERKHRMEKDNVQENLARLQNEQMVLQAQNELNNNALSISSLNTMGLVSNKQLASTSIINTDQLHLSPPYAANGSATIIQPGYLNSSTSFGNQFTIGLQTPYSLPFVPTAPVQTIVSNPVNVSPLPASLANGSSFNGGHNNMTVPILTPQDLANLSDYMIKLGIPPPATQQQWEALLSSINYPILNSPAHLQTQGTISLPRNVPDHSHIFANEQALNSLTTNTTFETQTGSSSEKTSQSNENSSSLRVNGDSDIKKPSNFQNKETELFNTKHNQNYINDTPAVNVSTKTQGSQDIVPGSSINSTSNSTTADGASTLNFTFNLTQTKLETNPEKQTVKSDNLNGDKQTITSSFSRTQGLPAKVYGPIGFRPVSFHVGSSR